MSAASAALGFPSLGGAVADFSTAKGNYHVEVLDASYGESKTGRAQLILQLVYKNDPNHPASEGKKLTRIYQSMPAEGDDADKVKMMKGIIKRMIFDGFGLKWSTDEKPFDPRVLVGKQAWVQVGDTKKADGTASTGITHVAQTLETLPIPRGVQAAAATAGAPRRGGRGRTAANAA